MLVLIEHKTSGVFTLAYSNRQSNIFIDLLVRDMESVGPGVSAKGTSSDDIHMISYQNKDEEEG